MTATAISGGKRRSRSEGESDRASSEHASSPAPSSRSYSKQQIRHRASIACASCRERRIRCVVGEGESECAQCKRTGAPCIIKDDDERRRPISKAYMSSLSSRIALLEEMLKERGVVPPPAVHPPKTRQEAQARQQQEQHKPQSDSGRLESADLEPKLAPRPLNRPPTPPGSGDEDVIMVEPEPPKRLPSANRTSFRLIDPLLLQEPEPKKEAGTRHLLSAKGSYILDQAAGRTRFFGPTANSHVHARSSSTFVQRHRSECDLRAEQLIESLGPATYDHLMRCFWEYYNSWQQVVDESAFEAGRTTQDARFYSPFLHLAMLAIAFRFADWHRDDMKMIILGNRESTFHRETKSMLEIELEKPGGIPSVQALLMLADLECGVGRDTTGWMYSGMANRLAFDIGLHANTTGAGLSELEIHTRRQVMAACVIFDRKCALLLGRPTAIKAQDIGVDVLPTVTEKSSVDTTIATVATPAAINRQMFELLELAGKVADFQNSTYGLGHLFPTKAAEDRAYLHFVGLERLFHNWYRRLPENLAWKPLNIKSAPMGFFMLHQQFHVCMILLHRPWAKYGPLSLDGAVAARYPSPQSPGREDGSSLPPWMAPLQHHDNRASMSRSMCTQHAIRIARIFWHHRQRFDGKRVLLSVVQHAGTAALALMAALAHKSAELDHQSNLRYLQVLSSAIYDMSHLYQPAARMYQLLKTMLVEIRSEMVKTGGFEVSAFVGRYQGSNSSGRIFGSSHWPAAADNASLSTDRLETIQEEDRAVKRRRLSSLSSVDLSFLTPSFPIAALQGCPSPAGSSQSQGTVNPMTLDQNPGESGTFDLDLFHSSFVDFVNSGGEGVTSQDWAPHNAPQNTEAPLPMLIPTASGDLSLVSCNGNGAAPKSREPSTNITSPPPPASTLTIPLPVSAAVVDDDDTTVDKTIEEWLAEPSKPAITAPADTLQQPAAHDSNLQTEISVPATINASPPSIHGHLSHATVDGTPICRDPAILSFETELGVGFSLGPDTTTTLNPSASSSSSSSSSDIVASDGDTVEAAIDWLSTTTTTSPPVAACAVSMSATTTTAADEVGVGVGAPEADVRATVAVVPPMTPVTLDELVQSVEEAVGSARARARARAAATGGGGNCGNGAGAVSPAGRNRELDFLSL
ncbi:hypothetical protein N657DRAFT_680477 [Parathielavia appendiculata]|uniref:Zn(2)-C6 fungal-type domain-containing protein n=1 Tax=Parathielavia appendiculata TaxID=2587402 RepID=A0AAN6U143_9PEZI|nr:hypothetical protein N657DRAFT_680477 [Parathielavia appendiculata]